MESHQKPNHRRYVAFHGSGVTSLLRPVLVLDTVFDRSIILIVDAFWHALT
jgi:hypothetical protein